MQWKGPYNIEEIVALNDCGINIGGKLFHVNLLKEYHERQNMDAGRITMKAGGAGAILDLVCATVLECDDYK